MLTEDYILFLVLMGIATLGAGWLPALLEGRPLSLPMVSIVLGYAASFLPWQWTGPDLHTQGETIERLSEILVLISLAGAGLSLDRHMEWRAWLLPRRLLFLAMPITVLLMAVCARSWLGLPWAGALLLAAALAPTDPVLASDVQVAGPNEGDHKLRFALTAEAGFNDGLAFPFTAAALAIASHTPLDPPWIWPWLLDDVLYRILAGVGVGVLLGRLIAIVTFKYVSPETLRHTTVAMVIVGFTLFCYGAAELVHGYGFLSVFTAALAVRRYHREHEYHASAHGLATQLEHILMVFFLVLFGMLLGQGMLDHLTWPAAGLAFFFVLVIRPLSGMVSLVGQQQANLRERFTISFLGIRGIGSVYYLSYAFNRASFEHVDLLWSTVAFVMLLSIFLHGASAPALMRFAESSPRTHARPKRESA